MGNKRQRDQLDDGQDSRDKAEESKPAAKRHQSYSEADFALGKVFENLADDVRATRLHASQQLLSIISTSDGTKSRKILTRLIRGLCSNRKAARLGFVITLTEVLAIVCGSHEVVGSSEIDLSDVLDEVGNLTVLDSKSSNQERKDCQLGRCLAYSAVIQSNVLDQYAPSEALEFWDKICQQILALYRDAPSLRAECGAAINAVIHQTSERSKNRSEFVKILLKGYQEAGLLSTCAALDAWIEARRLYTDLTVPEGVWTDNDPLHIKERARLLKVLRDNQDGEDASASPSGQAVKSPSPTWQTILKEADRRCNVAKSSAFFVQLWKELIDDGYFAQKASNERKAIGLQIFRMAVTNLSPLTITELFSPNLIRCVINQRSSSNNNLFSAVLDSLQALTVRSRREPDVVLPLLCSFINSGLVNFDRITKTKIFEELSLNCPIKDASMFLDRVRVEIRKPTIREYTDAETNRRAAADILLQYARRQTNVTSAEKDSPVFPWKDLLRTLTISAYLKTVDEDMSKSTKEVFRNRIMSVLTHILENGLDPDCEYASDIVVYIDKMCTREEYRLSLEADEAIFKVLNRSTLLLKDIRKDIDLRPENQRANQRPYLLLFALSILQVHNGDADAVSVLEELDESWNAAANGENTSTTLTELVLSFISRQSLLFRKLAEQVFTAICPTLDSVGLEALIEVLSKKENLSGQQELFDNAEDEDGLDQLSDNIDEEDSEDEDTKESDDDDDDSEASDVEIIDMEDADTSDDSSNISDTDSDVTTPSIPSNGEDAELEDFEKKLAQALKASQSKASKATTGSKNGDDDSDSSDDESMDDEEMFALDTHLTTIFRERSKQKTVKQDARNAKDTMIAFKTRVLDLFLILIKTRQDSPIFMLDIILPLIILIRETKGKGLAEKAFNVLKVWNENCNKRKTWPCRNKTKEIDKVFSVLSKVHAELKNSKNASKLHANAASRAGLFLVKSAVGAAGQVSFVRAVDMYANLQKDWWAGNGNIPASVFTEWTSWCLNSRKTA